jgi:hypothetical protein
MSGVDGQGVRTVAGGRFGRPWSRRRPTRCAGSWITAAPCLAVGRITSRLTIPPVLVALPQSGAIVTTRTWVGIVFGMAFSVWSPTASASDLFQYRDSATGCELIVDRADAIPRKSRDGARLLSASDPVVARATADACLRRAAVRLGAGGALGIDTEAKAIDARLGRNGGRYLTASELDDLKRLCNPRVSAYLLAVLAAIAAWIAVMVAAFREDHLGWAMLMLFLSAPMALVYLLTGLGKGHGRFKAVCALGMLSPLLVFLMSLWRALGSATG